MTAGTGPYGPLEMCGMFSVVKVREGIGRDDYADWGWSQNPPGTKACEWTGELPEPAGTDNSATQITVLKS
ncbi:hypothetical protein QKW60_16960 [Defluviimonas aestuarii]|uniref:hypothetical protein n=1 Tax=Albidovulum aestuarii TaxID=1130726 RepID=UPI00249A9A82|nr:hypothetical protein [Defluviimonas aestuarii]MDI3338101.1 hypothetical protein [Defluviimonas aestuarii]